ncbi:putative membrane protein [Paraburkholderia sp. GAS348]
MSEPNARAQSSEPGAQMAGSEADAQRGYSNPNADPRVGSRTHQQVGTSSADTGTTASMPALAMQVQPKPSAAFGAAAALLALIVLSVAWEWWLAPLRPGGSALVLKAVPLLLALPGVWGHRLYTLQWASMLILLYFAEGIVRGWSDRGLSARLGWLEVILAVVFFVCTLVYVAPFKRAAKRAAKQAAKENAQQNAGYAEGGTR